MAHSRFDESKKKKSKKRGGRKAQGRRLARFNELRRSGHSKAEAKVLAFGSHRDGSRGRKGAKPKRARKGGHVPGGAHRFGPEARKTLWRSALYTAQMWNNSLDGPPTARDIHDAEKLMKAGYSTATSRVPESERIRLQVQSRLEREKRGAAARLVAARRAERLAKEREQERQRAEAEVKSVMSSL